MSDSEAVEQAPLRLKQQVEIEIMKLPDAANITDCIVLLTDPDD